jgi:penicillin-binding protein 1A
MRAYEGDSAIIEAFKPGTGPSDVYSVIGGDGVAWGVPTVVNPEADKAAVSGTGGLY